jgi:hypothetical protein
MRIETDPDPLVIELLEVAKSIDRKLTQLVGDRERTYSLKEAASALGMSYPTALDYCKQGKIRYIDKGAGNERKSYVITQSAVDEYKEMYSRGGLR